MTHAIVLVEAERDVMSTLGGSLAEVEGVREAYSVTGEWDFVCIVHVKQHEDLANGVARTHTMVAFEAFSTHDLETMFSIGE
jgi:DNA-binding Lrp family transcriptional regulator